MSLVDAAMTREVMRDISKRPVDISQLEVNVVHGVVYLQGTISKLRGYHEDLDLHGELNMIVKLLRLKAGIRDVCCEVDLGTPSLRERLSPHKRKDSSM